MTITTTLDRIDNLLDRAACRSRFAAFLLGMREFRLSMTWRDPADDGEGYTERDEAYDRGRDLAHRLTFRRWDY